MAYLTTGLLLFETITGLVIYFLPFSLVTQFSVILHTAVGIPFLIPLTWYLIRHWLDQRTYSMNHYKATGYAALIAIVVCVISGVVLTYQAVFGTRISYAWDTIHVISTFAIVAFMLPHIVLLFVREFKQKRESRMARSST